MDPVDHPGDSGDAPGPRLTAPVQVMALYWILELLPLPITSLLPLVLLPLAGVASTDEVARNYLKVGPHGMGHGITLYTDQLCPGHQHDVRVQSDYGHSRGALRLPSSAESQPHIGDRDQ